MEGASRLKPLAELRQFPSCPANSCLRDHSRSYGLLRCPRAGSFTSGILLSLAIVSEVPCFPSQQYFVLLGAKPPKGFASLLTVCSQLAGRCVLWDDWSLSAAGCSSGCKVLLEHYSGSLQRVLLMAALEPCQPAQLGEKKRYNMSNEVVKKAQHLCHHFFTRRSTRFIKHALPACDMFRN